MYIQLGSLGIVIYYALNMIAKLLSLETESLIFSWAHIVRLMVCTKVDVGNRETWRCFNLTVIIP